MNDNRREFLKIAALLRQALHWRLLPKNFSQGDRNCKLDKFGMQLWTVKNALGKDPQGVLKQLADDGYKQIESFEGSKGIFWE